MSLLASFWEEKYKVNTLVSFVLLSPGSWKVFERIIISYLFSVTHHIAKYGDSRPYDGGFMLYWTVSTYIPSLD